MTTPTPSLLLGLALLGLPALAAAEGRTCAAHGVVVERLAQTWGESRRSIALGADGAVVETFASTESGTWTITVTSPGGPTCLVASGEAWEATADALDASEGA